MKDKKISAIFFDLGKVLVDFDLGIMVDEFSKYCPLTVDKMHSFIMEYRVGKDYMEGRITSSQFYVRTKKVFKMKKISFGDFYKIWNSIFYPIPQMKETLTAIKKNHPDIKFIMVSDTNEAHFHHIRKEYPELLELFDGLVLSHEVGKMKPHSNMYQEALKMAGSIPKETIYFDDRPDLIKAARKIGIKAKQFTTPKEFQADLKSLNLTT